MSDPGHPWAYPPAPLPGPQAGRRRRSRWLTVGLPVGLILLVLVGVGIVALVRSVSGALAPVTDAASSYADAVVEGRWADAQGLLCATDRVAVTPEDVAAHYASPQVTGVQIVGTSVEYVNGQGAGTVELVFTTADGLNSQTTLPMVQEDGVWRPCP